MTTNLQIPAVKPPTAVFEQSWEFPAALQADLAAYACQFTKPFWAQFAFQGDVRTATLPAYPPYTGPAVIHETLLEQTATGNRYALAGLHNITQYVGSLELMPAGKSRVRLTWRIGFHYGSPTALLIVAQVFTGGAALMSTALTKQFGLATVKAA